MCDGGMTQDQRIRYYHWTYIHGIILSCVWLLIADVLLLMVRYWKNWSKYLLIHSSFGIFNLASIFAIVIVMIYGRWELFSHCFLSMSPIAKAHSVVGLFILVMIVFIQIVGFIGKFNIESKRHDPVKTMLVKKIHIIAGYLIYFISKGEVMIGWWMKEGHKWGTPMTIVVTYQAVFFAIKFLFLQRWYINDNEKLYISNGKKIFDSVKYQGLLEMISNGSKKQSITREYPNIKYLMYKYKVYDVTNFLHPGGNYIIEKVLGEEISRYIHGSYGLENTLLPAYAHSIYASKLLQEHYIGDIDTSTLALMKPKIGDKINVPTTWTLFSNKQISHAIKCYCFRSQRYDLSTSPNILYLGRHFLMTPLGNSSLAPRLYTLTLCMAPQIQEFTKSMISKLNDSNELSATLKAKSTNLLPFVIKKYDVGGFSQFLYNSDIGRQIRIQGPFGRGLELTDGTFYAFCGGTGVLPLLDLIYQILLEVYFRKVQNKRLNRLPQNFKFILYLAIPKASFLNGLEIISETYLLSKKHGIDIFDLHLRISSGQSIKGVPEFLPRLNGPTINNIISQAGPIQKVFICGSPSMNYEIYNALAKVMLQQKLHIM